MLLWYHIRTSKHRQIRIHARIYPACPSAAWQPGASECFCRLPATSPLGRADEQPPPLAPRRLLLIMASGPAGPLDHQPGVLAPRR